MSQGSIKCVLTCAPGRGFIASGGNLKLLLVLQKNVGNQSAPSTSLRGGWLVGWFWTLLYLHFLLLVKEKNPSELQYGNKCTSQSGCAEQDEEGAFPAAAKIILGEFKVVQNNFGWAQVEFWGHLQHTEPFLPWHSHPMWTIIHLLLLLSLSVPVHHTGDFISLNFAVLCNQGLVLCCLTLLPAAQLVFHRETSPSTPKKSPKLHLFATTAWNNSIPSPGPQPCVGSAASWRNMIFESLGLNQDKT